MKPRRLLIAGGVAAGLAGIAVAPVWASLAGEENVTLVQILVEMINAKKELQALNDAAHLTAELTVDLVDTYQRANAGIEELKNYTFDRFLSDLKTDVYNQYPGIGELEYATERLRKWNSTRTRSPWTAYEAITAVVGDVSRPLREDIAKGNANADEEVILSTEAAGSFASADTAEEATKDFDDEIKELARLAENASPGQAQQLSARASLLIAAQQSYVMRLLARSVRMEGVEATLEYSSRIRAKNTAYERKETTAKMVETALTPPAMMKFEGGW